jgi:hypothetical protein
MSAACLLRVRTVLTRVPHDLSIGISHMMDASCSASPIVFAAPTAPPSGSMNRAPWRYLTRRLYRYVLRPAGSQSPNSSNDRGFNAAKPTLTTGSTGSKRADHRQRCC